MIGVILLVLAVAALLLWFGLPRRESAFPLGEIVYEAAGKVRVDEPLVSHRYKLTGQPDYVVQTKRGPVPVEVKSRPFGRGPHDGEKAQLFAYCLLVEEWMGHPVREGILQYPDREVRTPFGGSERAWVLGLLAEMQRCEFAADVARSHSQARKCQRCGVRADCGQALA